MNENILDKKINFENISNPKLYSSKFDTAEKEEDKLMKQKFFIYDTLNKIVKAKSSYNTTTFNNALQEKGV